MTTHVELRRGAYHDSVSLMQVSRAVAGTPGVAAAQVAMATELNVDVLARHGLRRARRGRPQRPRRRDPRPTTPPAGCRARGGHRRRSPRCAAPATRAAGVTTRSPPRTLGSAAARSGANLAVISVPGQHAVTEAFDAIASGLSVMLFSDNVSVEDEVRLKDAAAAADVLVMGPDCGTAHVGGVALGFANVVRPGSVGVVAASGTGAQQVMCLLDAAGVGPEPLPRRRRPRPQGRRRRPLHPAGPRAPWPTTPPPRRVLVVSKPPDDAVLADVEAYAAELGLRGALGRARPGPPRPHRGRRGVPRRRGPPGADLAHHARRPGGRPRSPGPVAARPVLRRHPRRRGDDRRGGDAGRHPQQHRPLTRPRARGRPHRPRPRRHRLRRRRPDPRPRPPDDRPDAADGADRPRGRRPDLRRAAARPRARPRRPPRPGRRARGCRALGPRDRPRRRPRAAGRGVADRHRRRPAGPRALRRACSPPPVPRSSCPTAPPPGTRSTSLAERLDDAPDRPLRGLLETDPVVATAGVSLLADALRDQAVPVTETQWQPPMAGTEADLARVMGDPRRAAANALAFERMTTAEADARRRRAGLRGARPRARHVPARRPAAGVGAGERPDARRAHRRGAVRGPGRHRRGRRAAPRRRRVRPRAVPPPRRGRADGRRHQPVDVGLRAARRRARPRLVVLAQRGPGQGAALRRLRPRGDRPAALDDRRARPDPAPGRALDRADRHPRDHRPDAADGRRGPQPQPRRLADAAARAAARHDHRRRVRRPTSPRRCASPAPTSTSSSTSGCRPASSRPRAARGHPRLDASSR